MMFARTLLTIWGVLSCVLYGAAQSSPNESADALFRRIQEVDALGDAQQAWQLAYRFLDTHPDDPRASSIMFLLPGWAQTWEDYFYANEEYLAEFPDQIEATVVITSIAQGYLVQKQYPELLEWLEQFEDELDFSWARLSSVSERQLSRQIEIQRWKIRALAATNRFDLALSAITELEGVRRHLPGFWHANPELVEDVELLKATCYMKSGRYYEAQNVYENLLRILPNPTRGAAIWWGFASCAQQLGQSSSYQNILERIVTQFPKSPEAFMAQYVLSQRFTDIQ